MQTTTYSKQELMITRAAKELRNGDLVFVGIGLPNLAANLAREFHAPEAKLIYESGVYGAQPERWPESIGDPELVVRASAVHAMSDLFMFYLQGGRIDVGFLGAAQIDRYGNLNTTVIGDYAAPRVRLPGSGGASDIALLSKRVVVIVTQSAQSFPEQVDFITSPGHRHDNGGWVRSTTQGRGPVTVVTDMAVFRFSPESGEMELSSLHDGVTLAELHRHMGWTPRLAVEITTTPAPSEAELALVRAQTRAR